MFPLDDPAHGPALFDPVLFGVLTAAVEEESAAAYEAGFADGLREARFRGEEEAPFGDAPAGPLEPTLPADDAFGSPPDDERLWTATWSTTARPAQ